MNTDQQNTFAEGEKRGKGGRSTKSTKTRNRRVSTLDELCPPHWNCHSASVTISFTAIIVPARGTAKRENKNNNNNNNNNDNYVNLGWRRRRWRRRYSTIMASRVVIETDLLPPRTRSTCCAAGISTIGKCLPVTGWKNGEKSVRRSHGGGVSVVWRARKIMGKTRDPPTDIRETRIFVNEGGRGGEGRGGEGAGDGGTNGWSKKKKKKRGWNRSNIRELPCYDHVRLSRVAVVYTEPTRSLSCECQDRVLSVCFSALSVFVSAKTGSLPLSLSLSRTLPAFYLFLFLFLSLSPRSSSIFLPIRRTHHGADPSRSIAPNSRFPSFSRPRAASRARASQSLTWGEVSKTGVRSVVRVTALRDSPDS